MKKILCVCLGNICRSPMAEGILRKVGNDNGIPLQVDSAGTAAYHCGEPAHRLSIKVAKDFGVDILPHRAQQFKLEFFDNYDLLLCMDMDHVRSLREMARGQEDVRKIHLYRVDQTIIEDPYYLGESAYVVMYHRLMEDALHWVKFSQGEFGI
jgi:protein-tyrosine phosphatase